MRVWTCALAALLLLSTAPAAMVSAEELVLDDSAATVQVTGPWTVAAATPGFYGDGYRYHVAGDGSNRVRWPSPAGTYEVFARWTGGPNRATNAPYSVTHAAGATIIPIDQRSTGAVWRSLGTFTFTNAADQGVTLSDRADGVVVADAIRFVPSTGASPAPAPAASASPAPAASATAPATTAPPLASPTPAASPAPTPTATAAPAAASAPAPAAAAPAASAAADERFFEATQFRVDRDAFWDFFQRRGGLRTFGYPVSREFLFFGCATQLFQRVAMQQCGGNGAGTLNLLDEGLLPYTHFAGSTVPAPDPALIASAPVPSDPDYSSKAIEFVHANAPDTLDGEPVGFFKTFSSTVTADDAFPAGGDAGLVPLLNLQLWGLPTSKPALDPNNHEFYYQRFQRGVMHYDRGCQCTRGLLLADYLKSVLTGDRLPEDLAAQAAGSPLLKAAVNGQLRASSFTDAFAKQQPRAVAAAPAAAPVAVSSPDYGMSLFLWGHASTTERDLKLVTDAGFRWQKTLFQWRAIEGGCKGCFDWSESDRVIKASAAAGVRIIARLDLQPAWARKDGAQNGPPDNYQDYADFVTAFVGRYSASSTIGRVAAIEVWNEVNLDREWGNQTINKQQAADYVRLLDLAYKAAKAADPSVIVISAGLSPTGVTDGHAADDVEYLQWLFDAGLKGKYDVLGAHGNTQAPEVDAAFGSLPNFGHASFYFRRIEQLREVMVRNGDADRQVWLLEFGWTSDQVHPNYSWFAVSEDKKAANILKAFEY
ncbi:MAG TPA: hypothetical protein VFG86_06885, partial [Chloroflexota bacterium]|nr:hypothetical protein [Chloroflexota bacterium]